MADDDGFLSSTGSQPGYMPPQSAAELLERYGRDELTLPFAELRSTVLSHVTLIEVDLTGAVLAETDLAHATLCGSVFVDADLSSSNLSFADLRGADLRGANLDHAELQGANLDGARLDGASLFYTVIGSTRLGGIDLSRADLAWVRHVGPSVIDVDALRLTARGLCEAAAAPTAVAEFLLRCGAPQSVVDLLGRWVTDNEAFPTCYIAHSREDTPFALRLYEALQDRGVRCWPIVRELLAAEEQHLRLDHGPGRWERVLLCCSDTSLNSWWLEGDIELALHKDRWLEVEYPGEARSCLAVVDLDGALYTREAPLHTTLRERVAAHVQNWERDDSVFDEGVNAIVKALT